MRDGARLAITVSLPAVAGPVPALVCQTRYHRATAWHPLARRLGLDALVDVEHETRQRLIAAGYAWIDVDARGSGASTGVRPSPWHREEVLDGRAVVDWVVTQPWSDGQVGVTGVSYGGTAAEMLAATGHPAIRAAALRFSVFDVYADVAFPGGLHLGWFTEAWGRYNRLLDANRYAEAVGLMGRVNLTALRAALQDARRPGAARALGLLDHDAGARGLGWMLGLLTSGVLVPESEDAAATLSAALAERADNIDVHAGAQKLVHRDDVGLVPGEPDGGVDSFSPHTRVAALAASGAAVHARSGWLDGAYAHAAIKRHLNLSPGQGRLVLGPWDHGGRQDISPFSARHTAQDDHVADLRVFFDRHLRGADAADPAPVRYYTLGAERWQSAPSWPPPHMTPHTLFLGPERSLGPACPTRSGAERRGIDASVGTGPRSRWRSLLGLAAPVGYGDRRALAQRVLSWTSAPLAGPAEVTGHAICHLTVSVDAVDAAIFCYLEDVWPDGRVQYVTEGQLRARHRATHPSGPYRTAVPWRSFEAADAHLLTPDAPTELAIDLQPVSYELRAGHRIRLTVAGADRDHFTRLSEAPQTMVVAWGSAQPSRLDLPMARPPAFRGR